MSHMPTLSSMRMRYGSLYCCFLERPVHEVFFSCSAQLISSAHANLCMLGRSVDEIPCCAAQERLLEQLSQDISAAMLAEGKQKRAAMRQLMCKVQEIHTTLLKHLAKEEEQLFPLLLKHFSYSEQARFLPRPAMCQLLRMQIKAHSCLVTQTGPATVAPCHQDIAAVPLSMRKALTPLCVCAGAAGGAAAVLHPADICGAGARMADSGHATVRAEGPSHAGALSSSQHICSQCGPCEDTCVLLKAMLTFLPRCRAHASANAHLPAADSAGGARQHAAAAACGLAVPKKQGALPGKRACHRH